MAEHVKHCLKGFSDSRTVYIAIAYCAAYMTAAYVALMAFFNSTKVSCIVGVCGLPIFAARLGMYFYEKKQARIETEFCILLRQLAMSVSSGSTLENAIKETASVDIKSYKTIGKALECLCGMLRNNVPVAYAFRTFADKCENTEINMFSEILSAGIPAGINMAELIRYVSSSLRVKEDVEQEIKKLLNAPKYNNRIIMAMPIFCILLFRTLAPSYIAPLYNGTGRIVMIAALLLIAAAWIIGDRISTIKY